MNAKQLKAQMDKLAQQIKAHDDQEHNLRASLKQVIDERDRLNEEWLGVERQYKALKADKPSKAGLDLMAQLNKRKGHVTQYPHSWCMIYPRKGRANGIEEVKAATVERLIDGGYLAREPKPSIHLTRYYLTDKALALLSAEKRQGEAFQPGQV